MTTAVVVGGGIAGIYSAILLKKQYEIVYLVEQEDALGGLLRSFQNEQGDWFDYGTHLIAGTNIEAIDQVVLNKSWTDDWHCFENEKAGNYFNDVLSESCLFVNAKDIGDDYYKGLSEFLEIVEYGGDVKNAEEQLEKVFGSIFAHQIYIPALCKLFCVDSLKDIVVDAHLRFGMKRLRVLNQEATETIKSIPSYDDRISHHASHMGEASRRQYYPKDGGVGRWVDKFEEQLNSLGVKVICGASVDSIRHKDGVVTEMGLSNGTQINVDRLVWTVPLIFMFKAANIVCESSRPDLINTSLFHYVLDKPLVCNDHFFFCYDPKYLPFRVTLYSNLQPEIAKATGRHRITVEVLSKQALDSDVMKKNVLSDLMKMGVVPHDSTVLYAESMIVKQGSPVLSHEFMNTSKAQYNVAKNSFKNVFLEGKNNTKDWFMHEIFKSVYNDFNS